ncbi:MAG: hypothetical protein ACOYK8_05850 [Alphaproteobacteria bacterium]
MDKMEQQASKLPEPHHKQNQLVASIAFGILAGILSLLPVFLGVMGAPLLLIAVGPLLVAGLVYGVRVTLIASLVDVLFVGAMSGSVGFVVMVLVFHVIPAIGLIAMVEKKWPVRLILSTKTPQDPVQQVAKPEVPREFVVDGLMMMSASEIYAILLAYASLLSVLMWGYIGLHVQDIFSVMVKNPAFADMLKLVNFLAEKGANQEKLAELLMGMVCVSTASMWFFSFWFCFAMGYRQAVRSKQMEHRPLSLFLHLRAAGWFIGLMGVLLLMVIIGFNAISAIIAFTVGILGLSLAGLAAVHRHTLGKQGREIILGVVYVLLISQWMLGFLAVIAMVEYGVDWWRKQKKTENNQ